LGREGEGEGEKGGRRKMKKGARIPVMKKNLVE